MTCLVGGQPLLLPSSAQCLDKTPRQSFFEAAAATAAAMVAANVFCDKPAPSDYNEQVLERSMGADETAAAFSRQRISHEFLAAVVLKASHLNRSDTRFWLRHCIIRNAAAHRPRREMHLPHPPRSVESCDKNAVADEWWQ